MSTSSMYIVYTVQYKYNIHIYIIYNMYILYSHHSIAGIQCIQVGTVYMFNYT